MGDQRRNSPVLSVKWRRRLVKRGHRKWKPRAVADQFRTPRHRTRNQEFRAIPVALGNGLLLAPAVATKQAGWALHHEHEATGDGKPSERAPVMIVPAAPLLASAGGELTAERRVQSPQERREGAQVGIW